MATERCDYAIVGQGLAGTLLAWQLIERGRRVVVIDRGDEATASRVAAGLINPVTGQRLNLSWRLQEFLPQALAFYTRAEKKLGDQFLHPMPMVRILQSDKAKNRWERVLATDRSVRAFLPDSSQAGLDPSMIDPGVGAFEVAGAHILDVPNFLNRARDDVLDVRSASLNVARDVELRDDSVHVRFAGGNSLFASRLVFCQGPDGRRDNPFFDWVPFNCAKGEILTLACPELARFGPRIHVGNGWIAPFPNGARSPLFRAGSTYSHGELSPEPTQAGREAIEVKLRSMLKVDFEVIDHVAGVRPIIRNSRAIIGMHPTHDRIGFFNGLGSKGSLNGPAIAAHFADHLEGAAPIDSELDLLQNM